MKGIKEQIEEANNYYNKLSLKDLENIIKDLKENEVEHTKVREAKYKEIEKNVKALHKKAKELNKEIPDELMAVIYWNQPMGSWFFEKHKEWFE